MANETQSPPLRLVQTLDLDAPDFADVPDAAPSADLLGFMLGASGEKVKALQQRLREVGFDPGEHNGTYGQRTADAVTALQRKIGVPTTGKFDEATANAAMKLIPAAAPATQTAPGAAPQPFSQMIPKWVWYLGAGALLYALVKGNTGPDAALSSLDIDDPEDFDDDRAAPRKPKKRKKKKQSRKAKVDEEADGARNALQGLEDEEDAEIVDLTEALKSKGRKSPVEIEIEPEIKTPEVLEAAEEAPAGLKDITAPKPRKPRKPRAPKLELAPAAEPTSPLTSALSDLPTPAPAVEVSPATSIPADPQ